MSEEVGRVPVHRASTGDFQIRARDPTWTTPASPPWPPPSASPADVLTNPDDIAVPARPTVGQGWDFAVAKMKELLRSHGDETRSEM